MNETRPRLSIHVIDIDAGRPGDGVSVRLLTDGSTRQIGSVTTDADGRTEALGEPGLDPGLYTLVFDLGRYFDERGEDSAFIQRVAVDVVVDGDDTVHIPLLVGPRYCSLYRGVR